MAAKVERIREAVGSLGRPKNRVKKHWGEQV